jgi:hypothetical protein
MKFFLGVAYDTRIIWAKFDTARISRKVFGLVKFGTTLVKVEFLKIFFFEIEYRHIIYYFNRLYEIS